MYYYATQQNNIITMLPASWSSVSEYKISKDDELSFVDGDSVSENLILPYAEISIQEMTSDKETFRVDEEQMSWPESLEQENAFLCFGKALIQNQLKSIYSPQKKAYYTKIFEPILQLLEPVYFTEEEPYEELTASVYASVICAGAAIYSISEKVPNCPVPDVVYRMDGRVDITLENLHKTVRLRIGNWGEPVSVFYKHTGSPYKKAYIPLGFLHKKLIPYFG